MLAHCLRSWRIISPAFGQHLVFAGYSSPSILKLIKRERIFLGYRQRVALYSAYRQRVGDISSVAAAKLSVSKMAWLEPWGNDLTGSEPY